VQGEDARVPSGNYRVRIYPRSGDWHVDGSEITARDGELIEVVITPQQAGHFFQKLGDRFYDGKKLDDAVSAWQRAVEIDPQQLRAHLRLGTTLPLQHRYRDAREHLDAVLSVTPNDKEAIEGVRLLDELEKLR
jgi:tetratricopeptide (TPR) repeat protein